MVKNKVNKKDNPKKSDEGLDDKQIKNINLYRDTIKRTFKAGTKNIDEDRVLRELRKTLNIDDETHERLKLEVKTELDKLEKIQKESKLHIQKMEHQIADLKKKNIDVKLLDELFISAKKARKSGEFIDLNEIIDEFSKISKNLKKQHSTFNKIEKVQVIIQKAQKMGANVKDVKSLLKKAEKALKNNQYTEANKLITEAKKSSTKLRKFGTAKAHIDKFIPTLNKVKSEIPVKESEKLVRKAKKALSKNDYDSVNHLIAQAKRALNESKREARGKEKIDKVNEIIENAREVGVDLVAITPMVKQLERTLKEKDYTRLTKDAANIKRVVEEQRKQKNAENNIKEAQKEIEKARSAGGSVKTAARYVSQAKTALKKNKYSQVYKYTRSAIKLAKDSVTVAVRRKAKSAISSVKFLIKDVKDFGVDVPEAEKLLADAEEALKKSDYQTVEKLAHEAEKIAKDRFEQKKREYVKKSIEETLINIRHMLDELSEIDVEAPKIEKLYNKGVEQLEAGKLVESEKTVKEAESLAKATYEDETNKYIIHQAENSIDETIQILEEARELEIDITDLEPKLEDAKELLADKKYEDVIEKTDEIKSKILESKDKVIKTRTSALIESTDTFINKCKSEGTDLAEAEKLMEEVKHEFTQKNYSRADELVRRAEAVAIEEWNQFRKEKSIVAIQTVEKLLIEAEQHGVDTADANDILTEALEKLNENDFDGANELIEKADKMAAGDWETQRKNQALGTLYNLRKMYDDLTITGTSVEEFKELIDTVEEKIDEGEFDNLGEYLNRANIISSELLREEKAQTYIERINRNKEFIKKLENSGIDVTDLNDLITEIENALDEKDFTKYDQLIEDLEDRSHKLVLERWNEISPTLIKDTRDTIEKSREIGGDVVKAEDYLAKAEQMMDEDGFDVINVEQLIEKADIEAKQSWIERKTYLAEEAMTSAQNRIQETKEMGGDVSEAEKLLLDVEGMFKDEDFDLIDDQLKKVNDMVQESQVGKRSELASEELSSTKAMLDETREMGADVNEADDLLRQAESMFDENDFEAVDEYIKKAEEAIQTSKTEFIKGETTKLVDSTKAKIEEGREQGADVSEAEELLKQAEEMLLSDFDTDTVENLIEQSQTMLASSWEQYQSQKLIDDISKMHKKLVDYRDMGLKVAEAELLLHKAEEEYKRNNFDGVDEVLRKIDEMVDQEYNEHFKEKITLLINDVQTLIAEAKERDLDVTVGEQILSDAMAEFEQNNYPKAEELANKAKSVVSEIIEASELEEVENLLKRIHNLIEDAKSMKIDVSPAEKMYRQAMALFNAKELKSASEYAHKAETILNSLAEKYVKDFHPNLTVTITTPELVVNKWNRFIIKILNDGRISAQDVIIDVEGDFETKGKKKIPIIEVDGECELELGLKSSKSGTIDVKSFIHCMRPFDKHEYNFSDSIEIKLLDPGRFVVQDVFVIYADGCLILHRSREYREMVDEDIFSSMLLAVQNFIADSFGVEQEEGIRRLDFGKNKILIENGPKFFLTAVVEGEEPGMLPLYMIETINLIQEQFGSVLENWDGYLEKLEGIGEIIDRLLKLKIVEGTTEIEPSSIIGGEVGGAGTGDGAGANEVEVDEFGAGMGLGVEGEGTGTGVGGGEGEVSTFSSVQLMITEAKEQGIDTKNAEAAIAQAQSMVEKADYSEVWSEIKKADDLIREARRDHYFDEVKTAINTVKELIDDAKKFGADVSNAEVAFSNMKSLVEAEDYPRAIALAEKCKTLTQNAKDEKIVRDDFSDMENNVSIAQKWGIQVPDVSQHYEEIETAIDGQDYDAAKTIINSINNDIKDKVIKKPIELLPLFIEVNNNIEVLKEYDISTEESEEMLSKAKQAIHDLDFTHANDLFSLASSKTNEEKNTFYQDKTLKIIDETKGQLNNLQKLDIDVKEAANLLSDAEQNYSSNKYSAAYESAIKSQQIVNETSHEHYSKPIEKTIISTENMLAQARERGMDINSIQPLEDLLNESKEALGKQDYKSAGEIAIKANNSTRETFSFIKEEETELQSKLDTTLAEITTTKEVGADTSEVEGLVGKMKMVLEEGDLETTKEYWDNIKDTLEKLQVPFEKELIINEIDSIEEYINETQEKGIDTKEAEHLLENAKTVMKTDDFQSVREYLDKARKVLDSVNETHRAVVISETIQSTYSLANEIQEMGAEVSYAFDLLKQAESMLSKMDLDAAEEYANNALTTTEDIKRQFLSKEARENIQQAENDIHIAKESGMKTKDAERLLAQAKAYLESGQFETANQYALNTKHLITDIQAKDLEEKAKEDFSEIQKLYKEVKSLGADVAEADAPLMQAQSSIKDHDYNIAITYIENAKNILTQIKQPFQVKLANSSIQRATRVIINAKNYGADISGAEELLHEAKSALTAQDFSTAEDKAKQAEKAAVWAEKNYYETYISNELKSLKDEIEKFKTDGQDTTAPEELLGEINTLYLQKNYQKIGDKIKKLRKMLVRFEREVFMQRAQDSISYTKAMINYIKNNIKDIGTKIRGPERSLKGAEYNFSKKEYLKAEQLAQETQEKIEGLQHSKLEQFLFVFRQLQAEEMIADTKKMIVNIKKLGVDLSESEELIKQAETSFQDEETYSQGQIFLTEAKTLARQAEDKYQEKNASTAVSQAESMIITLKQKGVEIDSANKYLNQAKTAIEIKEFKKAILFASKAKMTAKKLQAKIPKKPEVEEVEESAPIEEEGSPTEDGSAIEEEGSHTDDDAATPQTDTTEEEVINPNMTSPQ